MPRIVKWGVAALALLLAGPWVAAWIVLPRANPPERHSGRILSRAADEVLRRACFDCHSNETRWPWYAQVPPASLLLAWDVRQGRRHLNFSRWPALSPGERAEKLQWVLYMLRRGEMPLPRYLWLHGEARVEAEELRQLTEVVRERYGPRYIEDPPDDEREDHDH